MKASDHVILGVHVTDRVHRAEEVQHVLTAHGAVIRTRIGLHEADGVSGAPGGVLLLEMVGPARKIGKLTEALERVPGVEVQSLVFGHRRARPRSAGAAPRGCR